jgi:hypothetical protein
MEEDPNKMVRTYRRKLSHDVEVELCFSPISAWMNDRGISLVDGVGQNKNDDEGAEVESVLSEPQAYVDGEVDGIDGGNMIDDTVRSSSVFHIDISNFSGRLTLRRILPSKQKEMEGRENVGGGALDGNQVGAGVLGPLRPRLSLMDAEPQSAPLTAPTVNGEVDDSSTGSGPKRMSDFSHISMAGLEGQSTGKGGAMGGRRSNGSGSNAHRNGLVPATRRASRGSMLDRLRKETSMRNLANLPGLADGGDVLQTELHELVSSLDLTVRRMEEVIAKDPEAVKETDSRGRLPLHLLGANSDLVNNGDGQGIARHCAIILMELYPEAIVQMDKEGKMPFVFLIQKWVEWTHDQDDARSKAIAATKSLPSTIRGKVIQLVQVGSRHNTTSSGNKNSVTSVGTDPRESSLTESSNRFPPVQIFEEVEWCFEMLSLAMDHLGGKPLDSKQNTRPTLSYRKQRKDRLALAENLVSIPQVLKTTLLLESNTVRNKIMDSSAVRRALLCQESVGPWLTSMLRYKKGSSSEIAVRFLLKLSQLSVGDYVGDYRKPLPQDEMLFDTAKVEVYKAVKKLRDIVPSLLILNDELMDQALATPVIWFVMNRQLITPFNVGISTTDFQLLLTTIVAVRQASFGKDGDPGTSQVFPFMRILQVVFLTCLYSLIRRICEAYALYRLSSKVAYRYCMNAWHMLDVVGVACALWASGHYGRLLEEGKESHIEPIFGAMILGLLWIRVLSYLKGVNEHLATFILALTRVFFDIRFFCVVLLIVVVSILEL